MSVVTYEVAKKVYEGAFGRGEGKDQIVRLTGMNPGSAGDYISNFLAMMNGEKYTRTLNEYSQGYFLDHILEGMGSRCRRSLGCLKPLLLRSGSFLDAGPAYKITCEMSMEMILI